MAFITTGEGNLTDVLATENWLINQHMTSRLFTAGLAHHNGISSSNISTLTQAGSGISWSRLARRQGRGGAYFAISSSDQLYGWGYNLNGELGLGNNTQYYTTPTLINSGPWRKIATGTSSSAGVGIRRDGTLWAWGYVAGASGSTPTQVGTKNDWVDAQAVYSNFVLLDSAGDVWFVGNSAWYSGSSGSTVALYKWLSGLKIKKISAWEYSLVLADENGKLYGFQGTASAPVLAAGEEYARPLPAGEPSWKNSLYDGNNQYYEFPRDTLTRRFKDFDNWGYIFNSSDNSSVTFAIELDGSLWVYGTTVLFSAGLGTANDASSSWQRIGTDNDWKQVSCGQGFAAAVKEDGSLWTWGVNDYGQLGLGDTTNRSTPTRVGTQNYWKEVQCGRSALTALTYY